MEPRDEQLFHLLPHGITAIDTGYVRPMLDASHLVVRNLRGAFVDTGTAHSAPRLLDAVQQAGLEPEDVDYIFLTHIHLDHAGGAGQLAEALPNATVVVHPRGAKHLAEPDKLVAGTQAVYGEKAFAELYGEILPIPAKRIKTVADGERLLLGGSPLEFIHTPGHALHHYCMVDLEGDGIFTGDTFGISYRDLDTRNGPFIFPATTPTHFDPDQAHASIDRLMRYHPQAMYLTHYSRVAGDLEKLAEDLHADLVAFVEIAQRCAEETDRIEAIKCMMRAYLGARLDEHGFPDDPVRRDQVLDMDLTLNAQGLDVWLQRTRA